jgi:hypothetical protein
MIELKLPRQLQALYDDLRTGSDVPIDALFLTIGGDSDLLGQQDERSRSLVQSRLGSYITRLNRRLAAHNLRVQPGQLKRTYRLAPLK